jgi:predicted ATPase/class 3 adenylate cyclase
VIVCAECGHQNPPESRFCNACAAPLVAAAGVERRKLASVLFCDISGSTAMGERVDPESVRDLMFRYFHEMRLAIEEHGGTLEKFIGDAVVAVFGVPVAHEDDALRAVRAAVEMRERLETLNDDLERRFGVRIALRIGINSGEVVAGDPTSRQSIVTGDVVNVAARLEQAAPVGEIVIGEGTYRLVRDAAAVDRLEPLTAKGKSKPVPAYRVIDVSGLRSRERRLGAEMVGRRAELELLQAAFRRLVDAGSCELVIVAGEAGVGKSRLAAEFLDSLGLEATVLSGRCLSYGQGITYWPLAEVVRTAVGIRDEDSQDRAGQKIAALLVGETESALLSERIGQAIGLVKGAAPPEEIAWAAGKLFEVLARSRPLVLLFDDLHWAEPTFLDLVEHLAARAAPILVLGLARPELLEQRAVKSHVVRLAPLGGGDAETLVDNLLGDALFADEVRSRIVDAAGGNPLFLEELLAILVEDGLLRRENGSWLATSDLSGVALPLTIGALLGARLDRLESGERATIERGSIEGQVFHRGGVLALAGEELRTQVPVHLETLSRKDLVRPAQAFFVDEAAYGFRHILIRDAAYAATTKKLRAELHERFAEWLERTAGARGLEYEEILGHHLEQAYGYRKELGPLDERARSLGDAAADRLGSAGRRAVARGDLPAALNLLERAAALLPAGDAKRLQLLPDLGVALMLSGDMARAESVLSEAVDAAAADGDAALEARALVERAQLRALTQPDREAEEAERISAFAIPVLEAVADHKSLARGWMLLALGSLNELQHETMMEKMERALAHARRADNAREHTEILFWIGVALCEGPAKVDHALARIEELFAGTSGPLAESMRLAILASLEAMRGHFAEARRLARRSSSIYEELGLKLWAAGMANVWGPIELLAGDPVAAERELRRGYEGLERLGEKSYLSTMAGHLADALCELGRYEEADRMAAVSAEAAGAGDLISQILWRTSRARVLAHAGELEAAETVARDAVDIASTTDALETRGDALLALAEVLRVAGRPDDAASVVREALHLYEQKGVLPAVEKARALLSEAASSAAR